MRRLILNTPDGMYIEGVSTERNYYFFELDDFVNKAREEGGNDIKRKFVCFFDGERIVDETFSLSENLKSEIIEKMNKVNHDSVKQLNKAQENIELNRPFK